MLKRSFAILALCLSMASSAVAADWSKPTLTDTYTNFLTYMSGRINDAARWLDSSSTSPTNIPHGAKRWNASSATFEIYSGASPTWRPLASTYAISVTGNAATASNASALNSYVQNTGTTAGTIPVRDGTGKLPGDITGNAVTATSATSSASTPWSGITSKPTTLTGYGITDAAPINNANLTGAPTAPTPSAGDNSTKLATTAFVQSAATSVHGKQKFTSNGTFTVPAGVTTIYVTAVGGGGGGAIGSMDINGGGGGGGGAATYMQPFTVTAGSSHAITVGSGGAGNTGGAGGTGGITSVGTLVTCAGGVGGAINGAGGAAGGAGGANGAGASANFNGGTGGGTVLGAGAGGGNITGPAGSGYGAGGAGGGAYGASHGGGAGAPGIVIIEW